MRAQAVAALLLAVTAAAQGPRPFPFFNRGDPKIQSLVFVRHQELALAGKRVGILPFSLPGPVRPGTPLFEEILHQVLLADADIATAVLAEGDGWDDPKLTEEEQRGRAAAYGRSRDLDVVIGGRIDSVFHRRSGGLVLKVTLRLIAVPSGEVVFYASKKVDWVRSYPAEDCFRTLAYSFLDEWVPPAN